MAAIDKLHKLYSSTFGPLVWARSVGLEVLNEFDAVKVAIMLTAGGGRAKAGTSGWALAAGGIQELTAAMTAASMVGNKVAGMINDGVRSLLQRP